MCMPITRNWDASWCWYATTTLSQGSLITVCIKPDADGICWGNQDTYCLVHLNGLEMIIHAAVEFGCRCRLICWLYLIQLHACNAGDVMIIVNLVRTYICCILCHNRYSCGVMLLQQYNSVLLNVLLLIMLVVSVVSVRCNSRRWLLPHLIRPFRKIEAATDWWSRCISNCHRSIYWHHAWCSAVLGKIVSVIELL